MSSWFSVIGKGLVKWPLKVAAWFVVPSLDDMERIHHPIFGVQDASDLSYWNIAWRNGCHNYNTKVMPNWITTATNTPEDPTLEKLKGLQWRRRESDDGRYVSFRATWGKPHAKKGKKEFYIGWTLNENDYMRLTFFQFTPFRAIFG